MKGICGLKKATFMIIALPVILVSPLNADEIIKKVLLLNSYSRDYQWTEDITRGVSEGLKQKDDGLVIDIHVDYLDSKKYSSPEYLESMKLIQDQKMAENDYDLIITSDNNATDFVLENHSSIFRNIPFVFCGINGFNNYHHYLTEYSSGVLEEVDFIKTLDLANALQPKLEKYYVITDSTTTGVAIKEDLIAQLIKAERDYSIVWIDDISIYELQHTVKNISMNNAVILTVFNKDNSGETFSHLEIAAKLTPFSQAPIYSVWDFYMNHGIMGGYLTKGYTQGREAASIAVKYLKGLAINQIDMVQKVEKEIILDYNILKKYGISLGRVPDKAIIINKPQMFLSQYRYLLFVVLISFLLILFVLVYFVYSFTRKSQIISQMKNELETSNKDLHLLLEIVNDFPEIIYYKNVNGLYKFCNDSFSEMIFNLPPEEVIDRSFEELQSRIENKQGEHFLEEDLEILETGKESISRENILCSDRQERVFQMYKIPVKNKLGSVSGILGLLIDQTTLVNREKSLMDKIMMLEKQIQKIIIDE